MDAHVHTHAREHIHIAYTHIQHVQVGVVSVGLGEAVPIFWGCLKGVTVAVWEPLVYV